MSVASAHGIHYTPAPRPNTCLGGGRSGRRLATPAGAFSTLAEGRRYFAGVKSMDFRLTGCHSSTTGFTARVVLPAAPIPSVPTGTAVNLP